MVNPSARALFTIGKMSSVRMRLIYLFLRPTLLVLLCYSIAIGAAYLLSKPSDTTDDLEAIDSVAVGVSNLTDPDPSITPEQVVRIQLRGLSDEDAAAGIMQCMHFASPDNRAVTGPLQRFAEMVRNQKFQALSNPDRFLVGSAEMVQGNARVLVTLMDDRQLHSYVWVLSKQDAAPYENCWMTDAVIPLPETDTDSTI